jgi:hypothetical protein
MRHANWMSRAHRIAGVLAVGVAALSACGGSDGPTDPTADHSFSIAVVPSSLSLDQGSQGEVTVSVSRSGGFTGSVSLSVEGLPTGVSAGSDLTVPGDSSSLTVPLTAAANAASGSGSVTVRGTAGQLPAQTASLDLTIDPAPDVGIEITSVSPLSVLPGGSFNVEYTLLNPSGYEGEATVFFFLELGGSFPSFGTFTVEFAGSDLELSRELTTFESWFPATYVLWGQVDAPGDVNPANDRFPFPEPFILEAAGGDPHDVGVEITNVSPAQITPGDTLTFEYTLLNLTEYSGPVTVSFTLSTSSFGRLLLQEEVMLEGEPREVVRQVATPENLTLETYRALMRVQIENDIDPTNNVWVFGDVEIEVVEGGTE